MEKVFEESATCPFCHQERPVEDGEFRTHNRRTGSGIVRCSGSGEKVAEVTGGSDDG